MVQILVNCARYNIICAPQSSVFRSIIIYFYSHNTKNVHGYPIDGKTENSIIPSNNIEISKSSSTIPEPPTTCCMSGCANCVWIEYAENLTKLFNDGGDSAKKHILESVTDSNMRAFLMMELRNIKM